MGPMDPDRCGFSSVASILQAIPAAACLMEDFGSLQWPHDYADLASASWEAAWIDLGGEG